MNAKGSRHQSFIEVLEAELRKEIREELLKEMGSVPFERPAFDVPPSANTSARERLELWLSSRLGPQEGETKSRAQSAYSKFAANKWSTQEQKPVRPMAIAAPKKAESPSVDSLRIKHKLDAEDIAALEFFRRQGAPLPEDFTANELKSVYRKLALKMHPDRHVGAPDQVRNEYSQLFVRLSDQADRLARHVDSAAKKSAA